MSCKKVKLGEVCTVVSGSTPKTSIEEYWDGDVKWITPAEIDENSFYVYDTVRHITEEGKNKTGLSYLPVGTVILSSRAPIGKTAIAGCEMCCNQGFKNLICSDRIHNEYLFHFLSCKTDYLNSLGRGATFKEISKSIVESISIPLPEIEEQKQISEIFSKLNVIKRRKKAQLEKIDELVKSRFIEMFGDDTLTSKLGDVCRMINGDRGKNYPSGDDFVEDGVPFVNAGHLKNRKVDFSDMNYITEEKFNLLSQGKMQEGDILYCLRGSLGKHGLVDFERGAVASSLVILRCNQTQVLPQFLLYALETPEIELQLKSANNGSSQPNLSAASVKAYDIKLPTIEQQKQFVAFVEQTDKSKFYNYLMIKLLRELIEKVMKT